MSLLTLETYLQSNLESLQSLIRSKSEDSAFLDISRLIPKLLSSFMMHHDPNMLHKLFSLIDTLHSEQAFDESKLLLLIEDLLACIDSPNLPTFLPYLEKISSKDVFKKENESKCKSIVLRICNGLLRRLGRKEHKAIRYTIHKILADCMALVSERSGVNFRGQFSSRKHSSMGVCDNVFAHVQQVLSGIRDPFIYLKEHSKLERFIENIEKLLDGFANIESFDNNTLYTAPIYDVFDLQLKDSEFMIYFLGSIACFVQTLLKPATSQQETAIVLLESTKNKLNLLSNRAKALLFKIKPLAVTEIEHLLENELPWINWKLNKCIKFEKSPGVEMPSEEKIELEDGELAGEEVLVNKLRPLFEESERKATVSSYVERVLADLDPEEMIEEEFKSKNDPVFTWRFLRLVSYSHIEEFNSLLKPDLEAISNKLKSVYHIADPLKDEDNEELDDDDEEEERTSENNIKEIAENSSVFEEKFQDLPFKRSHSGEKDDESLVKKRDYEEGKERSAERSVSEEEHQES